MVSSEEVAVKVLQIRSRVQVDSVRREGQLLKDIEFVESCCRDLMSSGCVRAHRMFQEGGMACLVMEKLGESYVSILRQNKFVSLPLEVVRSVCTQVLRSLSFLHRMGLAHLDVKPHNILAVQPGVANVRTVCADGKTRRLVLPVGSEVKLVDFGGSKYVADGSSGYSYTTEFRSPEVILDLNITTATDMWSFGCVLYQLYTGKLLFPSPVRRRRKMTSLEHMTMMALTLGAPFPRHVAQAAVARPNDYARACFHSSGQLKAVEGDTVTADSVVPLRQRLSSPQWLPLLDLLLWCLQYNPAARPSAEQAMAHPFFSGHGQLHDGDLGALYLQQQLAAAIAAVAEQEEATSVQAVAKQRRAAAAATERQQRAQEQGVYVATATAKPLSDITLPGTVAAPAPLAAAPLTPARRVRPDDTTPPPQSPDASDTNAAGSPPLLSPAGVTNTTARPEGDITLPGTVVTAAPLPSSPATPTRRVVRHGTTNPSPPRSPDVCDMNTASSPAAAALGDGSGEPPMRRGSSLENMMRSLHLFSVPRRTAAPAASITL